MYFIIALVVLLFLSIIAITMLGSKLSEKFGLFPVILSVLLAPSCVFLVAYIYCIILIKIFGKTSQFAYNIFDSSYLWFLGLCVVFMIASFRPTHTTKSGKADRRYKDNPSVAPEIGVYLFFILVSLVATIYLNNHYIGFKMINFLK